MGATCYRAVLTVLLLAASESLVWADLPPPPYIREYQPLARFDNLEEYPQWRFFFGSEDHDGKKTVGSEVLPGQPFAFGGWRGPPVARYLLAVPRTSIESSDKSPAFTQDDPGVLRTKLSTSAGSSTFILDLNDTYLAPFRVTIANGAMSIEPLPIEAIRPEMDLGFVRLPVKQFAALLSLGLAVGGVWYVWRRRKKRLAAAKVSPVA